MYGHVITQFFRMGRLLQFLTDGAALARFARKSSAIIEVEVRIASLGLRRILRQTFPSDDKLLRSLTLRRGRFI